MVRSRQSQRSTRRPLRPGIALVIAGAFLVAAPALAGAEEGDVAPPSQITITQQAAQEQPACTPGILGLTNTVNSTAESFTLTVNAAAPPCDPIHATAVIYAMPGNGTAWPQRFVEKLDFTIDSAGTTIIEFFKTCDAQQFDVVVGETPEVIDVTGPWHGPLLFPFDTGTAEQYWGCVENSTTVPPETSTPTDSSVPTESSVPTDSSVPAEVLGTSTVPVNVDNANDPGTEVLGQNAKARELALTGGNSGAVTIFGVALVALGAGMVLFSRRRNAEA